MKLQLFKNTKLLILFSLVCFIQAALAVPPYSGTIFLDPDIITPSDKSTFQNIMYTGQSSRTMFDRRVNDWVTVNAHLFNVYYEDMLSSVEIQVNPEFGSSGTALVDAQYYGWTIGQLPNVLRQDVKTVWIHKGNEPFGGGNNNLLIHTGQGAIYAADGILEETFVHEAAHTSLDATHATSQEWLNAQIADGEYISTYAQDYPEREDVAESFLAYLAVQYRSNRIPDTVFQTITTTIPNRIIYFDSQALDLRPIRNSNVSYIVPVITSYLIL